MVHVGNKLHNLRVRNLSRIISTYLNINSIRNKFACLVLGSRNYIDILMISETKIDDSFPVNQFLLGGYTIPYRLDKKSIGGILVFTREGIPSGKLHFFETGSEVFFIEIKLRKSK